MPSPRLWRETAARWFTRWLSFQAVWESLIPARSKARDDAIRLEALPLAPLTAVLDNRNENETTFDPTIFREKGGTKRSERTRLPVLVLSTK